MPDTTATEARNMRKLRALIGMPVVCGNRRIGRVLRADLGRDLRTLDGIWVGAGLRGTRFIPVEKLQLLGRAAILADDWGQRGRPGTAPPLRRAVSTDGRRLGAITGAEIDELTLSVAALELSRGLWDDLAHARARVLRYTVRPDTTDVIVCPDDMDREGDFDEERHDEGIDHRHGPGRGGDDPVRGDELAGSPGREPEGQAGGQLDRQQGR